MDNREEKNPIFLQGNDISSNAKKSQTPKYTCGKNGRTGGGFAAEDANALFDELKGNNVDKVGRNWGRFR